MISVENLVNSRLKQKLKGDTDAPYYGKTLYFSSKNQVTPAEFPTLNTYSPGEISTADDLEHKTQCAIISTIELKAYTNTTAYEAKKLLNKAGDVMLSMGYTLTYGPDDISDTYNIVVARFRRLVGGGDIL